MLKSSFRVFLLLFSAVFLVYSQALGGEFLWDDFILVGENPFFKSPIFIVEVFRHTLFPGFVSSYYRPIQNWSYMLDYWIWNRNSFGYHLSNILFHAGTAFLLYLLLKKLIPSLMKMEAGTACLKDCGGGAAATIALVWAIHPIHNAAVAYIAGRADSLAALFALGAWLLWIQIDGLFKKRVAAGIASALLLMLALCSKEIALVWVGLFLFYIFVFDRSRTRLAKLATLGVIGLCLATYWVLRHLPEKGIPLAGMSPMPIEVRVSFALRALGDYVGLIFCPLHLQMERALYKSTAYGSLAAWQESIGLEYLSSIGLLSLLAGIVLCRNKAPGQRVRLFGAGWFLIGFLPISNLFPLNAQCAEHWIYMPSIGFLLFLFGCWLALSGKVGGPLPTGSGRLDRRLHLLLAVPIVAVILLLGIRTWIRGGDWATAETFYSRTIEQGGRTCRIQLSLADLFAQRGDLPGAEQLLRDAVLRYPGEKVARIHLGRILVQEGKKQEAQVYLSFEKPEQLVGELPKSWKIAQGLAVLKESEGKTEEALAVLKEALARYGEVWELVALEAQCVSEKEGEVAGIAILQSFTKNHWWHYGAFLELARRQMRAGDTKAAADSFRHAAMLDIHAVEPRKMIAILMRREPQR